MKALLLAAMIALASPVPTGVVAVRIQLEVPTPDVFTKLAALGFKRGQDQKVGAKTYYMGTLPAAAVPRVKALDDVVSITISK